MKKSRLLVICAASLGLVISPIFGGDAFADATDTSNIAQKDVVYTADITNSQDWLLPDDLASVMRARIESDENPDADFGELCGVLNASGFYTNSDEEPDDVIACFYKQGDSVYLYNDRLALALSSFEHVPLGSSIESEGEDCNALIGDTDDASDIDCKVSIKNYYLDVYYGEGYQLIDGEDQEYEIGSGEDLSFHATGNLAAFTGVLMDGEEVNAENYSAEEGSVIVNLRSSYLDTLSEGEHELTIRYTSGEVVTSFIVVKGGPKTFDATIGLAAMLGSCFVLCVFAVIRGILAKRR